MELYDKISPEEYENRIVRNAKERYLAGYWRPILRNAIGRFCKGKSVLDLGCGTGRYTAFIQQYANSVIGVDASLRQLQFAKEQYGIRNVICVKAEDYSSKTPFDVVFTVGLLEYVDREIVFSRLQYLVRQQGFLIILVPNKWNPGRVLASIKQIFVRRPSVSLPPSESEMKNLLSRFGFIIQEQKINDGMVWLPDIIDSFLQTLPYRVIEHMCSVFGKNPLSANMFFIAKKL